MDSGQSWGVGRKPTLTNYSDHYRLQHTISNSTGGYCTDNPIDITSYTSMKAIVSSYKGEYDRINIYGFTTIPSKWPMSSSNYYFVLGASGTNETLNKKLIMLDISTKSGSTYICDAIGVSNHAYLDVYAVWFE